MLFLLIILMMPVSLYAQYRVSSAYNKNAQIPSRGGITGREAAAAVMAHAGITDVEIVEIPGHLTDHYDPINKRLALSSEDYHGTSLAALGVAAHESGHAIQHQVGYAMLHARMALVPATNFVPGPAHRVVRQLLSRARALGHDSRRGDPLLRRAHGVPIGDAAGRIRREPSRQGALVELGILDRDKMTGVNQTLDAAALTYVAAFVGSLLMLLYLLNSRRNN